MGKVCVPPGDVRELWIRTTPAPLLPGSQVFEHLRPLHSALLTFTGVCHTPQLCRRQKQALGQALSGGLAWGLFLSSVSGFQKSLSQLVGTLLRECHMETNRCKLCYTWVTILVVNVVKHLVFSVCYNFCCLFLYFVQFDETGVVGLPVTGFHFLVFELTLFYIFWFRLTWYVLVEYETVFHLKILFSLKC